MTTKTILSNAFSLNMLSVMPANLAVLELSLEEAPRLLEGASTLPEGSTIQWLSVEVS